MTDEKRSEEQENQAATVADQASEPPQVFTKVRIWHIITGTNVSSEAVASAIHLSESKYCSVGAMVRNTAEFTTSFEVIPADVADLVTAGVQGQ